MMPEVNQGSARQIWQRISQIPLSKWTPEFRGSEFEYDPNREYSGTFSTRGKGKTRIELNRAHHDGYTDDIYPSVSIPDYWGTGLIIVEQVKLKHHDKLGREYTSGTEERKTSISEVIEGSYDELFQKLRRYHHNTLCRIFSAEIEGKRRKEAEEEKQRQQRGNDLLRRI